MAKVGTSALESRALGYLLESDLIVPHKDEAQLLQSGVARVFHPGTSLDEVVEHVRALSAKRRELQGAQA